MKRQKATLALASATFFLLSLSATGQNVVEKTFPCLKLVTDASTLSTASTYALIADDGENIYALKDAKPTNYKMEAVDLKDSDDLQEVFFTLKKKNKKYALTGLSTGKTYALYKDNTKYLYLNGTVYFKVCAASDYYNGALVLSNDGSDRFLAINAEKTLFGMYADYYNRTSDATTPSEYIPALLYEYDTSIGTISIKTSEGYGTYYIDKVYVMPEGVTGYTVTGTEDEELTLSQAYLSGETVPAGVALIVKGEVGEYKIYAPTETASSTRRKNPARVAGGAVNYLYGTLEDTMTPKPDENKDYKFYKLCYLTDADNNQTLGFYWGAGDGAAFTNKANRAYLALERSQASQGRGFSFPDNGQTQISMAVKDSHTDSDEIYTLSGTRLNAKDTRQLPAGVYVVGGKKYVK